MYTLYIYIYTIKTYTIYIYIYIYTTHTYTLRKFSPRGTLYIYTFTTQTIHIYTYTIQIFIYMHSIVIATHHSSSSRYSILYSTYSPSGPLTRNGRIKYKPYNHINIVAIANNPLLTNVSFIII